MSNLADAPAFPGIEGSYAAGSSENVAYTGLETYGGMTLRQHYAGLAMQGLCANEGVIYDDHLSPEHPDDCKHQLAAAAVRIADALIAELEKPAT